MDILCKLQHAYTSYSVNPLFSLSQKTNIHHNILLEIVQLKNIINHRKHLIETMYYVSVPVYFSMLCHHGDRVIFEHSCHWSSPFLCYISLFSEYLDKTNLVRQLFYHCTGQQNVKREQFHCYRVTTRISLFTPLPKNVKNFNEKNKSSSISVSAHMGKTHAQL